MGDFDYVVVGSGAGGGPLAANLAKAGFKVLLLEAGGDSSLSCDDGRYLYEVPIFHGLSTEYAGCSWDFYVRHYADTAQQQRDSKYLPQHDGVWYPRAGTLGGCTAHNAMITVVPQDSDWNHIAAVTGDDSWAADRMHGYFSCVENCTYVPRPDSIVGEIERVTSSIAELLEGREDWRNWSHGHGFQGWLTTSETDPKLALKDPEIVAALLNGVREALKERVGRPLLDLETRFDPNDSRHRGCSPEGLAFTPLAVANGKRNGPREYLLRTQKQFPNNLTIQTNALATRVLFENTQAVGVEFLEGAHLYAADPKPSQQAIKRQVRAGREVILCGGAFNSPQLLMLSGIGPRKHLESLGVPVVADLPGVGSNLQDRYEVGVVSRFARPFELLEAASFALPAAGSATDPYFVEWQQHGRGLYSSNGAIVGIIKRSDPTKQEPDLYIFGLPGTFRGYFPGYSVQFERYRDRLTWAILKARTNNTAGTVRLRSANATDTPDINFHYFNEGNDRNGADLAAVVNGVEFVRDMNSRLAAAGLISEETVPGPSVSTPQQMAEFIRNEAWGHHASCTNKMGAVDDAQAVLDSRLRVRGVTHLRVVDASVFPRIPGYFIVSAIYMVSEKASAAITEDARTRTATMSSEGAHACPEKSF